MAATTRREVSGSATSRWHWEQLPERPPAPGRRAYLARLLVATAVAAFLWILGHRTIAVAMAIGVLVVTIASITSPPFARIADRVTDWLQHAVTRGLTFLVLGAVELVVFTPIAVTLKLLHRDPLAAGSKPSDPTFWHQNPAIGRPSLHRRQFTYEARPTRARGVNSRLPLLSFRAALGLVVVVIFLDIALGASLDVAGNVLHRGGNGQSGARVAQVGAWAHEPWATQLTYEIASSSSLMIPQPLRGWTFPDYAGRFVHVKNGVRRSYEPRASAGTAPINVFFFGGSTMFGAYQRDEHTIPSQFARLAEAVRRPVRVVNYGVIGYGIWQELELLEELLTRGDIPDLVIFYDGANEQFIQARVGPIATPTHLHANIVRLGNLPVGQHRSLLGDVYNWWADRSAAHRLFDQIKSLVTSEKGKPAPAGLAQGLWAPDQSAERGVERGRDAVAIYQQAVGLVQHLAATYGFRAEFFWQPLLYTKPVVEGEQDALTRFGATPEAWYASSAEARRHLKPPVIDLSDVLDDVHEPVFVDFDHTNERGAEVIASAIYKDAAFTLNELSRRRQP
jgi:hypothetical protein